MYGTIKRVLFYVVYPRAEVLGFDKDFADFFFAEEGRVFELLLGELVVEVAAGAALRFRPAELAPVTGKELTGAAPRFLGFWLDVVVGPVDKFGNTCPITGNGIESRLMDGVADLFDVRVLFFELGVRTERVESELRVVDCGNGHAFSELEIDDSD